MTLEQLRKKSGLKAYAIADGTGISRQQYRKYEIGKAKPPKERVKALASIFQVSTQQIEEMVKAREEAKTNDGQVGKRVLGGNAESSRGKCKKE